MQRASSSQVFAVSRADLKGYSSVGMKNFSQLFFSMLAVACASWLVEFYLPGSLGEKYVRLILAVCLVASTGAGLRGLYLIPSFKVPGMSVLALLPMFAGAAVMSVISLSALAWPAHLFTPDRGIASATVLVWALFLVQSAQLVSQEDRTDYFTGYRSGKEVSIARIGQDLAVGITLVTLLVIAVATLWWSQHGTPMSLIGLFAACLLVTSPLGAILGTKNTIRRLAGSISGDGVVLRDAQAIEKLNRMNYLIIDRRLLLEDHPELVEIVLLPHSQMPERLLLQICASVEQNAEHPFGGAIARAARERSLSLTAVEQFVEVAGRGVSGTIAGRPVLIGNRHWLGEKLVKLGSLDQRSKSFTHQGKSVLFVSIEGECVGLLVLQDWVLTHTKQALLDLTELKVSLAIATGDHQETAMMQARMLGLERVLAEIPRVSLTQEIQKLKREFRTVGLISDVRKNDSALHAADLGIGTGSIDRFGFVPEVLIPSRQLNRLVTSIRSSRQVLEGARASLVWIVVYHVIAVPTVAFLVYPHLGPALSAVIASMLSSMAALISTSQSLRS